MYWKFALLSNADDQKLNKIYATLSPSRRAHIDRLKLEDDRRRSLLGEALARELLSEGFGVKNPAIHRAENGRPYTDCGVFISISHSGDAVCCAADTEPLGIDVERLGKFDARLIGRVCLEGEERYITENPSDAEKRFFEIWTAKEAYFKKLGTGITDFKSVDVLKLTRKVFYRGEYIIQII